MAVFVAGEFLGRLEVKKLSQEQPLVKIFRYNIKLKRASKPKIINNSISSPETKILTKILALRELLDSLSRNKPDPDNFNFLKDGIFHEYKIP